MSTATVTDYVAKRAELLARLVLTRRKGVEVFPLPQVSDTLTHITAHLPTPEGSVTQLNPYLVVQVKGTSEALEDERKATAYGRRHWKPMYPTGFLIAPIIFLLFSVEGDQGYFSWMLEPRIDPEKGPNLTWLESPDMTKISRKSIDNVFDKVEEWFEAMSEVLLRDSNK